jgi:enoyl-CoA hydratase
MTTESITFSRRGAALWIELNRPHALNSISPQMIDELHGALDEAERDADVRAVVITGAGRAFCAGADLKAVASMPGAGNSNAATIAFLDAVRRLADRIEQFRLPVIAAVNGLAIAGGFELVLACDLVVAAESARLGDGHAKYGLLPGGGGSVRLPRRVGVTRAKYLMFTAEYLTSAELASWGLVSIVAPDAELHAVVEALVKKLAEKSPLGLQRMKQLVGDGLDQPVEIAMRAEQIVSELHLHAGDRAEGLAAFLEKRTPNFLGT